MKEPGERLQTRYIALAGVELEGGWRKWPEVYDIDIGDDGSIRDLRGEGVRAAEIRTTPLLPSQVLALVPKIYPDEVNSSCGLHLHMSFKKLVSYGALCEDGFWPYLQDRLSEWGTQANIQNQQFWQRLQGRNQYCSRPQVGDTRRIQTACGDADRYAPVNYCWSEHKTVEVRVLPMFKEARVAVSALRQVLNATEAWIHTKRAVARTTRTVYRKRVELEV